VGQRFKIFYGSLKENSFTSNLGRFYWVDFKLSLKGYLSFVFLKSYQTTLCNLINKASQKRENQKYFSSVRIKLQFAITEKQNNQSPNQGLGWVSKID